MAGVQLSLEGDALKALQRKLKALDAKALRRELNAALRDGVKPLVQEARAAARENLPRRGGLADRVASRPTTVSIAQGGVRIRVKGIDAASANRGRLRHPTYGHRDRWVTQQIKPGWFTDRMRQKAPDVRPALVKAMDRIADKAARA